MKTNPKKLMHMICGGGVIRVAQPNIPHGHPAADVDGCYAPEHQAECLPQTEEAYADYCRRHPDAKLIHPTLAAYPGPRG